MAQAVTAGGGFPPYQRRIIEKCRHPSNTFVPFEDAQIDQSIPERFERQVDRFPDHLAVSSAKDAVTYAELNRTANRMARAILSDRGEGLEPIAVMVAEGLPTVVAMLAIMKAGKIYVPLGSGRQHHQTAHLFESGQIACAIVDEKHMAIGNDPASLSVRLLSIAQDTSCFSDDNVAQPISSDAPAYILFSSGSTGYPKGVAQSHRTRLQNICNFTNFLHICPLDRVTNLHSSAFGASLLDFFGALLNGAGLYCWDVQTYGFAGMGSWVQENGITILHWVPTPFRRVCEQVSGPEYFASVRAVVLGSEPATAREFTAFCERFPHDSVFVNRYGSIETLNTRFYFADRALKCTASMLPCGYELPGKRTLLLDENQREVGVGEVGEVVLESHYVTLGYWNRPDLSAAAFSVDPQSGLTRYRTGDLATITEDGCLTVCGRKHFEVKIRGKFVDLSAIERVLNAHPSIREAAVVPDSDSTDGRLLAYFVMNPSTVLTSQELRRIVASQLPAHMVPSEFIKLTELPTTPGGKVDRLRLSKRLDTLADTAASMGAAMPPCESYVAPRTELEMKLVRLWEEIIGVEPIGIHDSFLELGGDSVQGMRLLNRLRDLFGETFEVKTLFDASTVAKFADYLTTHDGALPLLKSKTQA